MPKILSPSDKFQMRSVSELRPPGSCLSCGNGTCVEGYVDLGTYFDYEGQMYLCHFCIQEAAEVMGCLTVAESAYLQQQNELLTAYNGRLMQEINDAKERLAAFDLALKPLISSADHSGISSVDDDEDSRPAGELVTGVPFGGTVGEPEVTEPSDEQGRNDSSRPELGNGFDL